MLSNENIRLSEALPQELEEIKEMKAWAGVHKKASSKSNRSFRSNELGGHMELKRKSAGSICPTEDYVNDLLKRCGKKLGIDYVAR